MFSWAYFQGSRYPCSSSPTNHWSRNVLSFLFFTYGSTTDSKNSGSLPQQEVVQFVAGVLRVLRRFSSGFSWSQFRMNPNSTSVRVVAQRHHQGVDFGQAVIEFEAGRRDVFHAERLALIDDADLLLLREVFGGIESAGQPQIDAAARGSPARRPSGRPCSADRRPRPTHAGTAASVCRSTVIDTVFIGHQVHQHGGAVGQEIEAGGLHLFGGRGLAGRRRRRRRLGSPVVLLQTPRPLAPVAVPSPCRGWPTD